MSLNISPKQPNSSNALDDNDPVPLLELTKNFLSLFSTSINDLKRKHRVIMDEVVRLNKEIDD